MPLGDIEILEYRQILKERIVYRKAVLIGTPQATVHPIQSVLSRGSYSVPPDWHQMQCSCVDQLHDQGSQYLAGTFKFNISDVVSFV